MNTSVQDFIQQCHDKPDHSLDVSALLSQMRTWRDVLAQRIDQQGFVAHGLQQHSPLQQQFTALSSQLRRQRATWEQQWTALAPAQELAQRFEDKVMFLVFGKFNAGKSSLCNALAECFRLAEQKVTYLYLHNGQIIESQAGFKEGATETTARLQGVCLGEQVILLDTPGLHSVTAENAALTQLFMDSADGVLWLSSSSSPGQVQELEALAQELGRYKPVLPVITRSDQIEEDEIDGAIHTVLCNKSPTQRALQQQDVEQRSKQKLAAMGVDVQLLRPAVSISAQMLRQEGFSPQAMLSSGLSQLFAALLRLVIPAQAYKQRKAAEIFLHYLQEKVLQPICEIGTTALQQLTQQHLAMQRALPSQQAQVILQAWRRVVPQLPTLLQQHAYTQDLDAVYSTVSEWANQALNEQLAVQLVDYQFQPLHAINWSLPDHIGYVRIPALTAEDQPTYAYDRLHAELVGHLQHKLQQQIAPVFEHCAASLDTVARQLTDFERCLAEAAQELKHIAEQMRMRQAA
ncbi:GTPase [Acinetobacter larvae]|uniref:G domain-containing protein n=1 Tax=Acinetobacter larvae TaxID=1789224 RepID=A0A1B2LY95_9GAMM|nr:GTPase [Acinetobacter larvae]AOA57911.1 hypothetical protein BFG52_05800 [Acinetobacter larvae]